MDLIPDEDLEVEFWPPRENLGGQRVFDRRAGVRVTHPPTGITATCDVRCTPHRNRQIAIEMIEAALTSPNFMG